MTMDLRGSEILGYRLVELIAEGGMGSVWRAEHPDLDEVRVVKVLKPHLAEDAEVRKRFRIEARIQVKLGVHPHIVKVENFDRKGLAILMEYVEGKTLAELIQLEIGKIPHERALPWMLQILSALEHAHGQAEPVIHRDIKPSNIIVAASDDTARVMDFGIAKVAQAVQLTQVGSALGTSAYMAPEQFTGAGSVDQRADIYSLGATFYEMLAGRPPFVVDGKGDSDFKFKLAHLNEAPRDPREFYERIPAGLVQVVLRCLEKAPPDRFQTVGQLRVALEGRPGSAAETRIENTPGPLVLDAASPGQAVARGMASSRWVVFGLLAVGLLALLVGGVLAVRRGGNDRAGPGPSPSGGNVPTGAADTRVVDSRTADSHVVASVELGKAGLQWVLISGGNFEMGSSYGPRNEKPVHRVSVGSIRMSKSEVTVDQYRACFQAGRCSSPEKSTYCNWGNADRGGHPVNCVDWNQAREFCTWAGGRLPSASEWEYAALSGGVAGKYPWGDAAATCSMAVMDDGIDGCGRDRTWPVCSRLAGNTSQGLCDMAGNVWEWVEDCWHKDYSGAPADGSAWTSDCIRSNDRVRRGGSWLNPASALRATYRHRGAPSLRFYNLGFRCAK